MTPCPGRVVEPVTEGDLMDQVRNICRIALDRRYDRVLPIGGFLAQTIAGPAATVPAALLSGLDRGCGHRPRAQGIALGLARPGTRPLGGRHIRRAGHRPRGRHRCDRPDRDHDRGDRARRRLRVAYRWGAGRPIDACRHLQRWLWIPATAARLGHRLAHHRERRRGPRSGLACLRRSAGPSSPRSSPRSRSGGSSPPVTRSKPAT